MEPPYIGGYHEPFDIHILDEGVAAMKMKDRKRMIIHGVEYIQLSYKEFESLPPKAIRALMGLESDLNENYVNLSYFIRHPELFDLEDMPKKPCHSKFMVAKSSDSTFS